MQALEGYLEGGRFFPIGQTVSIPERRRVFITILDEPVPSSKSDGDMISVSAESPIKKNPKLGGWEGKIWMADDFDAPIEDFKEYM